MAGWNRTRPAGSGRRSRERGSAGTRSLLSWRVLAPPLAVLLLMGPAGLHAQSPRDRLLVSVDWLADHLDDENLVLLHVGRDEDYPGEHIPGARFIQLSDISAPDDHEGGTTLSLQLPEVETLRRTLERFGISDDSRVVVYSAANWFTHVTRVMLTLDWFGLGDRSSVLDGGMQAWKAAGHALTDAAPPGRRGRLAEREGRHDIVVTADWLHDRLNAAGTRIIDARAPVYYDGTRPTYLHREAVRPGHVPGAANLPYSSVVDESLHLRSPAALEALFSEAGVEPGDTVVAYCHLGQQATAVVFAARTLGYEVRLYDGSFQDWGSLEQYPVETPGGGAR